MLTTITACIAFELRSQNFGVLLYRGQDIVRFEQFELLARNRDVMTCKGRLLRHFPNSCVELDYAQFNEPKFQSALVDLLVELDLVTHSTCRPKAKKGGKEQNEERDTIDPRLLGLFTGILRGLGRQSCSRKITKHSREEVLWHDAQVPWHRSASWMFLRVCLQLVLDRGCEAVQACLYKEFMAFLISELLRHGLSMDIPNHELYFMAAKFNRRFLKLSPVLSCTPSWFAVSFNAVEKVNSELGDKWAMIQDRNRRTIDLKALETLRFHADTALSLKRFEPYFKWISDRNLNHEGGSHSESWFVFTRVEPIRLPSFRDLEAPDSHMQGYVLADFEHWVAENLQAWLTTHMSQDDTCERLARLLREYYRTAHDEYQNNPVNLSIMWLTIMELWVACDKSATKIHPLLKDHRIGLPGTLLEPLLMPTKSHLWRLKEVEGYLANRDFEAKDNFPTALQGFGENNSFAARFYAISEQHQQLHQQIIELAETERAEKIEEFHAKKRTYAELQRRFDNSDHNVTEVRSRGGWTSACVHNCSKCSLEQEMQGMRINVHEWPLPNIELHAQTVVFELQVPGAIVAWRRATMALLIDMLKEPNEGVSVFSIDTLYWVLNYPGLVNFTSNHNRNRLQLASTKKPFINAHYKDRLVSEVEEKDVCQNHACQYNYYDRHSNTLLSTSLREPIIPQECSFSHLSNFVMPQWISGYNHTSNQIISCQVSCPREWAVDEFKAFGHLRSGVRLQWRNILTQLMIPSLDLNRVETAYLIIQAAYQAGPATDDTGSIYRNAHRLLENESSCMTLVSALRTSLVRVEENWECDVILLSLAILCTRLLSLSPSGQVHNECFDFLARVRAISRRWVDELLNQKAASDSESERNDLDLRILGMALICVHTFDVEPTQLEHIFSVEGVDTSFIETSIIIHDHTPKKAQLSPLVGISLQIWRRLSYQAVPVLSANIANSRCVLDKAIATFWAAYTPGTTWTVLGLEYSHVLKSQSASAPGSRGLSVSLSLLDGSLLVNGQPLSRLPKEFQDHPTYARLFGTQILEIIPSQLVSMEFSAAREQGGWVVHFAMIDGDLIVQACKEDTTWEFIPPSKIIGDFPASFINPCSHWFKISSGEIEFRSFNEPWNSRGEIWRMARRDGRWFLHKGNQALVDPRSTTAKAISGIFKSIEDASHMNLILDQATQRLEVRLPRYDLSFTIEANNCTLRSKHYPGMCVDGDQSFGTLVGLESQLVLRPENSESSTMRAILVPHGIVASIRRDNNHPITIIRPSADVSLKDPGYPVIIPHQRHHCFHIDNTLGRLVENGSLQSKLLLCNLHAASSHCLPDKLTERTGTEESLRILKSAAMVSFDRLENEDIRMLSEIASISPQRIFYPTHLKNMQRVKWSNALDPLAQSDEFSLVVQSILNHGASCEMFYPDDAKNIPKVKFTHPDLRDRALIRCSTFRVSGFGAAKHTPSFDADYSDRGMINDSAIQLEQHVCQFTKILLTEQQVIPNSVSNSLITELYKVMGEKVAGPVLRAPSDVYKFKSQWLDMLPNCIGGRWCQVQKDLCRVNLSECKYDLMTFFAALVFAEDANIQVIQTLLAFTSVPALKVLQQPRYPRFILKDGYSFLRNTVESCMVRRLRDMTWTPEWSLSQHDGETYYYHRKRRRLAWEEKTSAIIRNALSGLERQWPTASPSTPNVNNFNGLYLDVTSAMGEIQQHCASWEKNRQLHQHMKTIISIMIGLEIDQENVSTYAVMDQLDPLTTRPGPAFVQIAQLFAHRPPRIICEPPPNFSDCYNQMTKDDTASANSSGQGQLLKLLSSLRTRALRVHERGYVDELERSFRSCQVNLEVEETVQFVHDDNTLRLVLKNYVETCRCQVNHFQRLILTSLRGMDYEYDIAVSCFCFPRLTPIFILQQLNRHNWSSLSVEWQRCFVAYCLALTHLQRSERLLTAVGNTNMLLQEMKNVGHTWDPMVLPESLLLEVESGLMIREVQENVADQMRSPGQDLNSVMQLNMGEGKSSVIVQIVAASLANGTKLVRIIVAKPQSKQMRHMLISKLGGLLDRQVFFMPFSRSLVMDTAKTEQIRRTLTKCMKNGGVLLVQPEHLLSFKLMGIEYVGCHPTNTDDPILETSSVSSTNPDSYSTGIRLIEVQKFLDQHCRDVIDESDENFSVKFELIYTIGAQSPVDMSPDRWIIVQNVLSLVRQCAPDVQKLAPAGIQLEPGETGQFATLRLLKEPAGNLLLQLVARILCEKGVHGLPVAHQSPAIRQVILNYILDEKLTQENSALVHDGDNNFFSHATKSVLLLLRGLFAGGVLKFALSQKRWRVNYGLAERKPPTLAAVPYRAKDSPAPRAEFSHPDIVIILTCLSYYYGGLSSAQLFTAFEHLQRSDQADDEFANWVRESTRLPPTFRQLSGINLKDRGQFIKYVFPALKLTKAAIDFYLDKVVFPKEMVEFPRKLSASGWDLGKSKSHPVTGFSGTCDSKYVLPLEVRHLDLPDQLHTNAMVLNCLLRPENLVQELDPNLSSRSLLESVVQSEPPIQVVLDVGALIVELNNEQVARMWLDLTPAHDKQAAIFFSDTDELLVINRGGFIEQFLTSPFAADTKDCLVFLDEAHTRGIDLKLPSDYRASVTLGPRLTKDRLVQGKPSDLVTYPFIIKRP